LNSGRILENDKKKDSPDLRKWNNMKGMTINLLLTIISIDHPEYWHLW
jgi:hypothetical protein